MGNSSSLPRVHANVDSPSIAGLKTCVSDPLDAYCTRDEFFHELMEMLREPVGFWDVPCLKGVEVEWLGSEECTVKVVLDGAALQELDSPEKQATTKDYVRMWLRLSWDLAKWELLIHTNDNATGKLTSTIRVCFLKDPFRIETLFVLNPQNADATLLAWIAESQWLRPVIHELGRRKTKLSRNVESPYGNGSMVTISDALDGLIDFDTLWQEYFSYIKSQCVRCEEISDSQFEVTIIDPRYGGVDKKPLIRVIKHDKSTGEIVDVASLENLRLLDTRHIKIHREPLRVEHWTESNGKRIYRRLNSELLQQLLDTIVPEKEDRQPGGEAAESQGCVVM